MFKNINNVVIVFVITISLFSVSCNQIQQKNEATDKIADTKIIASEPTSKEEVVYDGDEFKITYPKSYSLVENEGSVFLAGTTEMTINKISYANAIKNDAKSITPFVKDAEKYTSTSKDNIFEWGILQNGNKGLWVKSHTSEGYSYLNLIPVDGFIYRLSSMSKSDDDKLQLSKKIMDTFEIKQQTTTDDRKILAKLHPAEIEYVYTKNDNIMENDVIRFVLPAGWGIDLKQTSSGITTLLGKETSVNVSRYLIRGFSYEEYLDSEIQKRVVKNNQNKIIKLDYEFKDNKFVGIKYVDPYVFGYDDVKNNPKYTQVILFKKINDNLIGVIGPILEYKLELQDVKKFLENIVFKNSPLE